MELRAPFLVCLRKNGNGQLALHWNVGEYECGGGLERSGVSCSAGQSGVESVAVVGAGLVWVGPHLKP